MGTKFNVIYLRRDRNAWIRCQPRWPWQRLPCDQHSGQQAQQQLYHSWSYIRHITNSKNKGHRLRTFPFSRAPFILVTKWISQAAYLEPLLGFSLELEPLLQLLLSFWAQKWFVFCWDDWSWECSSVVTHWRWDCDHDHNVSQQSTTRVGTHLFRVL